MGDSSESAAITKTLQSLRIVGDCATRSVPRARRVRSNADVFINRRFSWVPLGATGATFCPGLAAFGNRNCFKSLTLQGCPVNSHAGGQEPVGLIVKSITYGELPASISPQFPSGCQRVPIADLGFVILLQ